MALGIDFSTLAIHVSYGPPPVPFRLRFGLDHLDPEDRMGQVFQHVDRLLASIEERWPNLKLGIMAIERPWMGGNARTLITLTQVEAACVLAATNRQWFAIQEDPNKIRKQILGVGSSNEKGEIKRIAKKWVMDTFDLRLDSDAADSLVIWAYAQWLVDQQQ